MAQYFNISGELTQQLLAPGDNVNVSKISLTNIQKVSSCKVDLYIEKTLTGKFYLMKGVELPIGATLIYDDIKTINYDEILFHKVDRAVNNTKNKNSSLINKYEDVPF